MRWVFIFLVFLNLFFYIWQRQQTIEDTVIASYDTSQPDENIPTIKLLSEQPIVPATTENPPQTIPETATTEETLELETDNQAITQQKAIQTTCLYLGGVTNKEQLAILLPYLTEIDSTITPIEIELKQSPRFQLYLNTDNEKQQIEMLSKLKTLSINTLLNNKGYLKNLINLGSFASKADFLIIQQQLQELQLTPQIEQLPKAATSYWLKIPEEKQAIFTPELLTELANKLPTMQQELMLCNLPAL